MSVVNINGYRLERTCHACPEQYDVFKDGKMVAYFRLRHGTFRVDVPDCGGDTIYMAYPEGDGIFEIEERAHYLAAALRAVENHYSDNPTNPIELNQKQRDYMVGLLRKQLDNGTEIDDTERATITALINILSLLSEPTDIQNEIQRILNELGPDDNFF